MLSTSGVEYTKVCGKILAYQVIALPVHLELLVVTLMVVMLMESA